MHADDIRGEELEAAIREVRDRVRARYPQTSIPRFDVPLPDLLPILHARDAAEAKAAAIGTVNPRAGGPLNALVQVVKKAVARALDWHVREQVEFNRNTMLCVQTTLEALNEMNRTLGMLAAGMHGRISESHRELSERLDIQNQELSNRFDTLRQELTGRIDTQHQILTERLDTQHQEFTDRLTSQRQEFAGRLDAQRKEFAVRLDQFERSIEPLRFEVQELKDIRMHWAEWRQAWEQKLATNEIQFLRSVADLQGAFQHRATLMEANFRDIVKSQHADYLGAIERSGNELQARFWGEVAKARGEFERQIHTELRLIRQRAAAASTAPVPGAPAASPDAEGFDYARFAERFRGSEEYVKEGQKFYAPYFSGQVLDIGCGRGEFLEIMREAGTAARGIDLSAESVAVCRGKGLDAEKADLFVYLEALPDRSLNGIFSAQVVEHLPPERLPEMIRLAAAKLDRGGVLAIETPNPECLAIFATHFYLDPTHRRPVPHPLLSFYMEESGLGRVEVHRLSPAVESMPELGSLPGDFREAFFGGLDYAIIARRLD